MTDDNVIIKNGYQYLMLRGILIPVLDEGGDHAKAPH